MLVDKGVTHSSVYVAELYRYAFLDDFGVFDIGFNPLINVHVESMTDVYNERIVFIIR